MGARFTFCHLFLFFLLLSSATFGIHAKQGDALNRLKWNRKTSSSDAILDVEVVDADNVVLLPQVGLKEKDQIEKLPGQPDVKFNQYGGYVTVDDTHGRAFYYYFVEAEQSSQSKPLLLWLNGGPGCSSMAYGAMEELGPFRVGSDGKTLFKNDFAWNKVANVLFLESPAGVGFSYSNTTSDYDLSGDKQTAKDNYAFLLNWLERFPEYQNRDFYVSGESYAGHYVPQLAHNIQYHNKIAGKKIINLKGIIIGNAVINDETDDIGMYDYWWSHSLISDQVNHDIHKFCDFSETADDPPTQCSNALTEANKTFDIMDIYNIYGSLCHNDNLTATPRKPSKVIDPCSDDYVIAYLNTPEVQKALHANVTKLDHIWEPCSDVVGDKWKDSVSTVLPLLQEFMADGLRVWVISGDTDGRVPVTSTKYSLDKLKLPVKAKFQPWYLKGEVGGFTIVYKGDLTFTTVRGAGHEVPSFQPERALILIKHFLEGKPLPIHQ